MINSSVRFVRYKIRIQPLIGAKNNARVNLKINEPEGGSRRPRREDSNREGFRREERVDTNVVGDLEI